MILLPFLVKLLIKVQMQGLWHTDMLLASLWRTAYKILLNVMAAAHWQKKRYFPVIDV